MVVIECGYCGGVLCRVIVNGTITWAHGTPHVETCRLLKF